VGGGQIRHVVTFGNLTDCGRPATRSASTRSPRDRCWRRSAAAFSTSWDSLALVLSSNAQVAAPKFTLNLDLNAGVGFAF
jgi:hypothetical protein